MPRVKPIEEYPEEYFEIFQTAYTKDKVVIQCDSHNEAAIIRAHLYTFRSVVRNTAWLGEFQLKADDLVFQTDGDKLIIRRHKAIGQDKLKEALDGAS